MNSPIKVVLCGFFVCVLWFSGACAGDILPGDVGVLRLKNKVRFTIVTDKGYYNYLVGSNWRVRGVQGRPPISMVVLDVPIQGTEFANVTVGGYSVGSSKAKKAIKILGRKVSRAKVSRYSYKGWMVYRQYCQLKDAKCKIVDAVKTIGDVKVGVRLVLSLPKKETKAVERRGTEEVLHAFLRSVYGKTGKYKPVAGEIVRRKQ